MSFIPASDLKKIFDVFGHFYSLKTSSETYQCRSSLEIVRKGTSPNGLDTKKADAILFLSLISGRNPELLIGKHVLAAPLIKASGIEVLPTGYMLIDGGKPTTASYVSGSLPIPNDKPKIAGVTALAGEMLGLKINFLDAGSGATKKVTAEMIKATSHLKPTRSFSA